MNLWYEVPIVLAILLYKLTVLRVLWNWSDTRTFAAKTTETFDLVHEWVGDRVKPFKQWKDAMCWIPVCFLFYQSPYHGWAFIKCLRRLQLCGPFSFWQPLCRWSNHMLPNIAWNHSGQKILTFYCRCGDWHLEENMITSTAATLLG